MKALPDLLLQPNNSSDGRRHFTPLSASFGRPTKSAVPMQVPSPALQRRVPPSAVQSEFVRPTEPTESQIGLALRNISPVLQPKGLRAHRERRADLTRYHDDIFQRETSNTSDVAQQHPQTVPLAIDRSNRTDSARGMSVRPGQQKPGMAKPPPPPLDEHHESAKL